MISGFQLCLVLSLSISLLLRACLFSDECPICHWEI